MEDTFIIIAALTIGILLILGLIDMYRKDSLAQDKLVLLAGKTIIQENLVKARITRADISKILKKADVETLTEVNAIYYYGNGDIVVDFAD
jgi:hypothetical protein